MVKMSSQIHRYYVFTFLKDMSFFAAVLVPFFIQWGGLTQSQVQLLQSWFMFWFFVLEVPTGAVADYLGRKTSLTLGAVTVSIAAFIYGSTPSFSVFLFAEFLFAIAMSLISGADQAWIYDTLKEEGREQDAQKVFGRADSFHLAAILFSSSLGGLIARQWGLNAPMAFSAVPFFLAALVGLSLKEPKFHSGPSESKRYLTIVKEGVQYLYSHPQLWRMALDSTIVATAAYFVIWLYQPLLANLNVPIGVYGFIHSFLVFVQIIIATQFDRLGKWFSFVGYERVSAVLVSVGFLAVATAPSFFTVALFLVLSGGFGLTRITYISSKMQPFIDSKQRATVLSAVSMLRRFALVIFNPLVGVMVDRSLGLALMLVGILPLVSLVMAEKNQDFKTVE